MDNKQKKQIYLKFTYKQVLNKKILTVINTTFDNQAQFFKLHNLYNHLKFYASLSTNKLMKFVIKF